jgi:hypothetical protein
LEKTKPQAVDSKKPKKKAKGKKGEKENQVPDDNDESLMPPPTANADKTAVTGTIKKLTYAYRLSYSCTLKLFKLVYGYKYIRTKIYLRIVFDLSHTNCFNQSKSRSRTSDEFDNTGLNDFLCEIKADESFYTYLTNVLQQQLDALLDPKAMQHDIESYDRLSLFKYLHSIWK